MCATPKNAKVPCSSQFSLHFIIIIYNLPNFGITVDCEVGPWSAWDGCYGHCTIVTGGGQGGYKGTKKRAREVVQEAKDGGAACPNIEEMDLCYTQKVDECKLRRYIDKCESSPCQNGGFCSDAANTFTCDCANTGYTGQTCEVEIDECRVSLIERETKF